MGLRMIDQVKSTTANLLLQNSVTHPGPENIGEGISEGKLLVDLASEGCGDSSFNLDYNSFGESGLALKGL